MLNKMYRKPVSLSQNSLDLPCLIRTLVSSLLLAGIVQAASAFSARLEIYASGVDSIPVAVIPFETAPDLVLLESEAPWVVIADNLSGFGPFSVIRSLSLDTAYLVDSAGVSLAITGLISAAGDSFQVALYLIDLYSGDRILALDTTVSRSRLRTCAHRFSNKVYETLTGTPGPFDSQILYVRGKGGVSDIFCADFDGFNARMLTRKNSQNLFPAFADPGTYIRVSYQLGKPDIFMANLDGTNQRSIVATRRTDTSPAYSPIEGRVVYASSVSDNTEIYVCNANGGERKQLTFNRAIDTSPCWSPDGYLIAFISDRTGVPQVYVMDNEGGNVRRLTYSGLYEDSPAWSPRGDKIAYAGLSNGQYDIWVVDVDGSGARRVSSSAGKHEYPAWSPDASRILFQSTRRGVIDLYSIKIDGSDERRITNAGDVRMPDWSSYLNR